jgi:hypothetical protein
MADNTKLRLLKSSTLDRLRASLIELGPKTRLAGFGQYTELMLSAVDLLAKPAPTERQLKAAYRSLHDFEEEGSCWAKARPRSRAKAATKLAKVVTEVLLIPRFAAAPMSQGTVREIQSRMPKKVSRPTVLKAIQRRQARRVAP